MSYYLDYLKTYPLIWKNKKHAFIAYPFTLDTETSHTPLNRPEDVEASEENPFLPHVDISEQLTGARVHIPDYIAYDIDIGYVKRVFRRHKIKIDPAGIKIHEIYENYSFMWSGHAINEADQLQEIIEHIATQKDINIATIDEPITKGVNAWIYQWAVCFRAGRYFSDAIGGRTSRELAQLINDINIFLNNYSIELSDQKLKDYYKEVKPHSKYSYDNPSKSAVNDCRVTVSCIFYIHNMGYDYEYLYPFFFFFFNPDEFFMRPHTPLIVRLSQHVEMRDSYLYFNDSLERLCNSFNVDHKKRIGLVDYDKEFFPDDKLSCDSWEYQFYDVLGLWECIVKDFEKDNYNIVTAPLTSTGKVRRECKNKYLANPDNRKKFTDCYTPGFVHWILQNCFMGGYTHGNRDYKNELIKKKIGHRDMRSFYPTELRKTQNLYQCGRFEEIEAPTIDMLLNPEKNTISMGLFTFTNARLKKSDSAFPFMSMGRVLNGKHSKIKYSSDNGRALYVQGVFSLYLTDVDFLILYDQYIFDSIEIELLYTAPGGLLPQYLRDFIDDKFYNKTVLKNILKEVEKNPASTLDDIIDANTNLTKGKNKFNGIYGMFVTNPAKPDIVRNADGDFVSNEINYDAKMNDYFGYYRGRFNKNSKGFLVYSHGVWCTAYARRDLYYMLKIADNAKQEDGRGSGIYADTDSLFYIQSEALENIYEDINKQMYDNAISDNYYITVNNKIINYDAFESEETCDNFKFLHSKCYAMTINNQLYVTVAGVPERKMIDIDDNNNPVYIHRAEELQSIDHFNDGFTFHKCGGTGAAYIHRPIQTIYYNGHYIEVSDACVIIPTTKKIKDVAIQTKTAQETLYKYGRGEL